jgi:glycosyltransferase XagB
MGKKIDYKSLGSYETHQLLHTRPDESAYITVTQSQKVVVLILLLLAILFIIHRGFNPEMMYAYVLGLILIVNLLFTLFYVLHSFYKLFLISISTVKTNQIVVTPEEIGELKDEDCPVYTILVPLYHETETLKKLTQSLELMDYPKDKLDVKLLLEEDDKTTIEYAGRLNLPAYFDTIIVPHAMPKTKPKACNLGLSRAKGKYLVIYDAEDRPEPDQLKKAVIGFGKAKEGVICLQAKLNFYNRHQNLLTRWFTSEYSTWFDLYLPGLGEINSPIPLGGTSNHFVTSVLNDLGGWDPYNVAEDCDLGVRLYRHGHRTQMLDSTTWEEACANLPYWIRQRSRWIKGYIQTYLVHSRKPLKLLRDLGIINWLNFQFVIGGNFLCFLLNPIYWLLVILWFFTRMEAFTTIFPPSVFVMGALCLFVGNFSFIYITAIGSYRRKYYDLVKYSLIILPYWMIMSLGAWKGFLQLIFKPHYWEKTKHGFFVESGGSDGHKEEPVKAPTT